MEDVPSDWRTIGAPSGPAVPPVSITSAVSPPIRGVLAIPLAVAAVVVASVAFVGALWVTAPAGGMDASIDRGGNEPPGVAVPAAASTSVAAGATNQPVSVAGAYRVDILVDVEGAVRDPGLYRLPRGSRVGDAIEAAGGFAGRADLGAAAQTLNLAQSLSDGDKVNVPSLGDVTETAPASHDGAPAPTSEGGLVDINHADEAALDALPGIGPVTVGKILAARAESLFTGPDDLQARGIVGPSTMAKIRDLVTALP